MITVLFDIGNTHELIDNKGDTGGFGRKKKLNVNTHRWTAFVSIANPEFAPYTKSLIKKVRFGLHPVLEKDYVEVSTDETEELSITYESWGYFEIPITIYWQESTGLADLPL